MKTRQEILAGILCLLVLLLSSPAFAQQEPWQAGSARIKITPDKLIWMSGYGSRDHPAEGKLTDLWAKALAIRDPLGNRGLIITLDLVGIDRGTAEIICGHLRESHDLQRRQVAICTSHTHTGPSVGRNLAPLHYLQVDKNQQAALDSYTETLVANIRQVAGEAVEAMRPSLLSWGSGHSTVAVNRRTNREANVPGLRLAGQLVGPSDHDVPVLAVRSPEGELKTVLFGYACHATVLSFYQWSGDYPGFAQAELERLQPGVNAMFWAGCGADQNPLPRRTVELAQQYGARLAAAVNEVVNGAMKPIGGTLATHYDEVDLPLAKLPGKEDLVAATESSNRYEVARARMLLEQIESGVPLSQTYPYPVATWKLGDTVQWVVLGGEVVIDYALRAKLELGGRSTWVAGYSNDVMAYIPSRRVLTEGGYEGGSSMVYYGLPAHWAPELEEIIMRAIHAQVNR
tara:strand:+ start:3887 stop:5260 length:1374 start_codon:yes stop_codon:yes gene_type:complete